MKYLDGCVCSVLCVFYARTYREPTIKRNNHYLNKESKLYETRCESKLKNKNSPRLKMNVHISRTYFKQLN
jgi:hypothetical protein